MGIGSKHFCLQPLRIMVHTTRFRWNSSKYVSQHPGVQWMLIIFDQFTTKNNISRVDQNSWKKKLKNYVIFT